MAKNVLRTEDWYKNKNPKEEEILGLKKKDIQFDWIDKEYFTITGKVGQGKGFLSVVSQEEYEKLRAHLDAVIELADEESKKRVSLEWLENKTDEVIEPIKYSRKEAGETFDFVNGAEAALNDLLSAANKKTKRA